MNSVDVYGRLGNVVTSESGLEVINNNVAIILDPNLIMIYQYRVMDN